MVRNEIITTTFHLKSRFTMKWKLKHGFPGY
ncbi:unnamed protein product [Larinioides sclopetarius]|uniref:Uncharacterized protein n=1 Tax=Larinioides sclopetarius TaxID=280406 RepID=A0AAV1Z284_9ARAC